MSEHMTLWREAAALRLLAENGHRDLVEPLRAFLDARRRVEPGALEQLLAKPEEHRLRIADGYLVGPDGSVRVTAGLRLLLAALQSSDPVEHAYTRSSAERILRKARGELASVDARLAAVVRAPVVGEHEVRAMTRKPVSITVVEEAGLQ